VLPIAIAPYQSVSIILTDAYIPTRPHSQGPDDSERSCRNVIEPDDGLEKDHPEEREHRRDCRDEKDKGLRTSSIAIKLVRNITG
jgi:hypothetical protein